MLGILLVWLFLGVIIPTILLLISGNIRKLLEAITLCLRYLIWPVVLAAPAVFIWISQNRQLGSISWEWVAQVDPDTVEELLWVIGIVWAALLPIFLMGSLLRTVLESAPAFVEEMRTQETHKIQQKMGTHQNLSK